MSFFKSKSFKFIMLPTFIIGVIISTIVAVYADFDTAFDSISLANVYYPIAFLLSALFFKSRTKDYALVASLICSPMWLGLIGLMIGCLDFFVKYSGFGITFSVLIFEFLSIKN